MQKFFPRGYALLLGILLMTTILTITLTVTTLLVRQVRLSTQVVDAAQALAAADAGTERALYQDFRNSSTANFDSSVNGGVAPFVTPGGACNSTLSYTASFTLNAGLTTLNVQGSARCSQRSLRLNY